MTNRKYNNKAINDVYKNAHIALQSLSDLIPSVKNKELKKELKDEREGYQKMINEISSFMESNNLEPKDIGVFQKAIMWCSIKTKVLFNNSKNQVAEMMIKGTVMGITELTAMKNESKNLDDGVKNLVEKLLKLEENYQEKLKAYL